VSVISDASSRGPGDTATGAGRERRAEDGSLSRRLAVGVAIVVAVGVALRLYTTSDLWLDEALTVNVARLPLADLRGALKIDGAPPLFYLLLHVWTGALGTSDIAARSLSGVIGVATLPLAWYAGRRAGGTLTAWAAVVVLASNPFAVRYATEVRMYGLEILLVFAGILAFRRGIERPSAGRVALFGLIVALLVYTQYWAFYLLAVVSALLLVLARRGPHTAAARRLLIGLALGGLSFAPWVTTFLYQRAHTGTPWGEAVLPGLPIGETFSDFAGSTEHEGWLLLFPMTVLILFGVFGRAADGRSIEIDLRTRPDVRWEALVGIVTLVAGTTGSYLMGSAFQSRYSAIILPFYVLVVARGVACFADRRVLAGVCGVVVALGFTGGFRNLLENRTQAGVVASVLRVEAEPGDLVVYCPDQLGPSVSRGTPSGLDEVTYPFFGDPARVDWVDYEERLATVAPSDFAVRALARAGDAHAVWLVSGPGYRTHKGVCEALAAALGRSRDAATRVLPDEQVWEKCGLVRFSAR